MMLMNGQLQRFKESYGMKEQHVKDELVQFVEDILTRKLEAHEIDLIEKINRLDRDYDYIFVQSRYSHNKIEKVSKT